MPCTTPPPLFSQDDLDEPGWIAAEISQAVRHSRRSGPAADACELLKIAHGMLAQAKAATPTAPGLDRAIALTSDAWNATADTMAHLLGCAGPTVPADPSDESSVIEAARRIVAQADGEAPKRQRRQSV